MSKLRVSSGTGTDLKVESTIFCCAPPLFWL